MQVSDLRAQGDGVPILFELVGDDRCFLVAFVAAHAFTNYNADLYSWLGWEDLLEEVVEAAITGHGQDEVERIIDEHAWNVGAKRVE